MTYPRALLALLIAAAAGAASAADPGRDTEGFPIVERAVSSIVAPMWSSEEDRDAKHETEQVFAAAGGIKAGMTVADVGAGSGYYTMKLSPLVGASGKVLAEDITASYVRQLQRRVDEAKVSNVFVTLGAIADPRLPAKSVDIAFLIHMYHEMAQPYGVMWRLAGSMKPNGKVAIVDHNGGTGAHGTPPALLKCEMEAIGYRQTAFRDIGDDNYVAVFTAPARLKEPAAIKPCAMKP